MLKIEDLLLRLNTENKSSIIDAINELDKKIKDLPEMPEIPDVKGYALKGSATFNSTTGRIIPHTLNSLAYEVSIIPTENARGYLGEVWVEKSMNSFAVYCSGTSNVKFDYIVFE